MIELTPLDVRKKRGDFRKGMRGYDPGEVDSFMELVAERLETLVKENMTLKERSARLAEQVKDKQDREKAVQEALVTAQALRKDISGQAQREAELMRREAEAEIERMLMDAENRLDELRLSMDELDRRRRRFLRAVRAMLERELDFVGVEEGRDPLADKPLELELFIPRSEGDADAVRPWEAEAEPAPKGELLGADEEPLPSSSPAWLTGDQSAREGADRAAVTATASVAAAGAAPTPEPAEPMATGPTATEPAAVEASTGSSEAATSETPGAVAPTPVAADPLTETATPEAPGVAGPTPGASEALRADTVTPVEPAASEPAPEQDSAPPAEGAGDAGNRRWEPHWRFTLGESGTKDTPSE